jgi:hypothetical protein
MSPVNQAAAPAAATTRKSTRPIAAPPAPLLALPLWTALIGPLERDALGGIEPGAEAAGGGIEPGGDDW